MADKALSIRQPWASLIVAGIQTIENRTTLKNYRGPVWVHAGKKVDKEAFLWLERMLGPLFCQAINSKLDYPTGGIIGRVEIYDCVEHSSSAWFTGPHGFLLRHPLQVDFYPCPGRLGFFDVEVPF